MNNIFLCHRSDPGRDPDVNVSGAVNEGEPIDLEAVTNIAFQDPVLASHGIYENLPYLE